MASNSFPQYDNEPFCEYFNRLVGYLDFDCCSLWEACEICYFGLNEQTRDEVECMHNGEFRALSIDDAWDFYVWFAWDVYNKGNHDSIIDMQCVDTSNISMNSHDLLHDPLSEPRTHDFNSISSFVHDDEVHAQVDANGVFQYSSLFTMPSCDVLRSLNDESHVFDCAPTPQCDVYAHDLNVDFSNLGCTSSSLVEPQPSTPFESLIATFESQIRCIELDNELGPSNEMILNSMRGQLEIMKKNEERLEEGRRRKEELESQLSPLMLVCEKSQFNVCVEDDDDDFEQPRECEDPIGEHLSDGEGVEN